MDRKIDENDGLKFNTIAGGSLIDYAPVFSPKGDSLFLINKNIVQVFSTTTAVWLKDFEIGTTSKLIGLQFDLFDPSILIGCSKIGEVAYWKWETGELKCKENLLLKDVSEIETFNLINISEDSSSALITYKTFGTNRFQSVIIDIKTGKSLTDVLENLNLSSKSVKVIVENRYFHYFAIVQSHHIHVVHYKTWKYKKWSNANKFTLTCAASHPIEEMIATGDIKGRIFIWRELWNSVTPKTMLYHWHHTGITSLAFTNSGTGFYSGGLEAVLVKWKLGSPDLREYLPRMISTIAHICVSKNFNKIAVCTSDNGIEILDGQNQVKCILQNFTFIADNKTELPKYPTGLLLNPRTNSLVSNGRTGHLQFFSTYTKSLLYNMDIVNQNPLSLESNKILYDIRVTQAAFNVDWMATGEVWNDLEHAIECRLKFWEYQTDKQIYSLNTSIELPHHGGFKAIKFSNHFQTNDLLCATLGYDNFIKIWSLEDSDNIYKKGKVWFCIAKNKYKNLNINSLDFSEDGSLLSAGYGNSLCIFLAQSLKIKEILSAPPGYDGTVQKVQVFLGGKTNSNNNDNKSLENEKRNKKVMELFNKFIDNGDCNLLNQIKEKKNTVIQRIKINTSKKLMTTTIKENYKEQLFKNIRQIKELNLFQKILLYKKMKIFHRNYISEKSNPKLYNYLNRTTFKFSKTHRNLFRYLYSLNIKDRFKAIHKLKKILRSTLGISYDEQRKPKNIELINGNSSLSPVKIQEENAIENEKILALSSLKTAEIKIVLFGTGQFSHLVIVSTEHRILIWNLLNLKLQSVSKISAKTIVLDPLTSLFAVLTLNNELFILQPNTMISLYHRIDLPNILSACWVPRRHPKSQSFDLDWQSISSLYFLTENQELMHLSSEKDTDFSLSTMSYLYDPQEMVRYSTFGALAMKKMDLAVNQLNLKKLTIGVPGKVAIKTFIEMATNTMAPINSLCNNFINSQINKENSKKIENLNKEDENSEDIQSEDEEETTEMSIKMKLRKVIADKSEKLKMNKMYASENLQQIQKLEKLSNENFNKDFKI